MKHYVASLILGFCAALAYAKEPDADAKLERVRLENGVTLLLVPMPEASLVAVEAFYAVGFVDEPAGMTQVAHLLEHLMLQGATKSYAVGESFVMLRKMGVANAETLPTFTHYDYSAPPSELATILKIEGERLTSLTFTPELIAEEGDKCNEEADIVYQASQSGMVKHAFMALFQSWNHGVTEVRVRRGVDQLPQSRVEAFYRTQYRPDQLTLAIAGKFSKDDAVAWAREHLGPIENQGAEQKALNWSTTPASARVTWDVDLHALCVFAAPPADAKERALLSLWGTALFERLAAYPELRELAHMSFVSNTTWPVGELPFFVYATARKAEFAPKIQQALIEFLRDAPQHLGDDVKTMRTLASLSRYDQAPAWKELQAQAVAYAQSSRRSEQDAMAMVLTNIALQWGMREVTGTALASEDISEATLRAAVDKVINPAAFKVVYLAPPPEVTPTP